MKKGVKRVKTSIATNFLEIGESIEEKMRRVTQSNEPIENVAPMLYTERKDGVLPETDIRTDRFEVAQEAMGKVEKSIKAKREEKAAQQAAAQQAQETQE